MAAALSLSSIFTQGFASVVQAAGGNITINRTGPIVINTGKEAMGVLTINGPEASPAIILNDAVTLSMSEVTINAVRGQSAIKVIWQDTPIIDGYVFLIGGDACFVEGKNGNGISYSQRATAQVFRILPPAAVLARIPKLFRLTAAAILRAYAFHIPAETSIFGLPLFLPTS